MDSIKCYRLKPLVIGSKPAHQRCERGDAPNFLIYIVIKSKGMRSTGLNSSNPNFFALQNEIIMAENILSISVLFRVVLI